MPDAIARIPTPAPAPGCQNEPVLGYLPGSPERAALSAVVARQRKEAIEIPLIIGGREVHTGIMVEAIVPHDHGHVLAVVHQAGEREIAAAIEAAVEARCEWSCLQPGARAAVFLKAAELLAGPWRMRINAATMLNQSKTCHQAEIDAACELIDFLRFNCAFAEQIEQWIQPPVARAGGASNRMECRGLEGFIYAVTPFNFTSIAGNLPHAPALMGGTAIWKPSPGALVSNYLVMKLFMEAGLPGGVINFVPGDAEAITRQVIASEHFAGLHYTGSTAVFRSIWKQIAANLERMRGYPRIVGETGGKDFIVAHSSCDREALVAALVRGAFEYQGQKCSAVSRAYIPRTVWEAIREKLVAEVKSIGVGDPTDYGHFMGAVIHRGAFDKCKGYIERARAAADAEIIAGGMCKDEPGYFVQPTVILATNPKYASMCEEIFGPILTVFIFDDAYYETTLKLCDESSPYALTGAIFAQDRGAIEMALDLLRDAAGNFYINDKPTGAVVGQQPFGGARASGTNDKAGSWLNLVRWTSARTIKETFDPPRDYRYAFLESD